MSSTTQKLVRELERLVADFPTESRALGRRAVWRVMARFTPVLAIDRAEGRLYVSTADDVIGRRLFVYPNVPEQDIGRAFAGLALVPDWPGSLDGRTVVEIGANIGSHTVDLIRRHGAARVVAIEPSPDNCQLLLQNTLVNGVADRVTLLPLAVSERSGTVALELSAANSGDHRVRVGDPQTAAPAGRTALEVRAASFDSLVDSGEVDLAATGLIWMDAQGHEGHILRGASRLLDSSIPIMTEYWPYGLRRAQGLDLLHETIAANYSHVIDVNTPGREGVPRILPADQLPALEAEYGWSPDAVGAATDLVLARSLRA